MLIAVVFTFQSFTFSFIQMNKLRLREWNGMQSEMPQNRRQHSKYQRVRLHDATLSYVVSLFLMTIVWGKTNNALLKSEDVETVRIRHRLPFCLYPVKDKARGWIQGYLPPELCKAHGAMCMSFLEIRVKSKEFTSRVYLSGWECVAVATAGYRSQVLGGQGFNKGLWWGRLG